MLDFVTQRSVVITLAIIGAIVATIGNRMANTDEQDSGRARAITKSGYAITGLSILLFIIAGFRAG